MANVQVIDNNAEAELAEFARVNSNANHQAMLWHLHGKAENSGQLVLTPRSYCTCACGKTQPKTSG